LWRRIIKNTLFGVFKGVVYYWVFWVLIPWLISIILRIPFEQPLHLAVLVLGVFIGLGVASSSTKPFIGIILSVLSALLALNILVGILGGVVSASIEYSGVFVEASLDYTPLLVLIVGFTVIYAIIDCFERFLKLEE